MGIIWDHASIVDSASQILFPLQYKARKGIGKGIPDQPQQITISVTPRRPRNFVLEDGETLKWSWDKGAVTGLATGVSDTVTIDSSCFRTAFQDAQDLSIVPRFLGPKSGKRDLVRIKHRVLWCSGVEFERVGDV